MSITRWDPMSETMSLRQAMDRLLEESFVLPALRRGPDGDGRSMNLALDVRETSDSFVVTAPVAGVTPADVEVTVLGHTVRIRGERREERQEGDNDRWLLREQWYGAFERTLTLPVPVQGDEAKAEFKDGLLTITLPKADEAKERRIPVHVSGTEG